MENLIIVQNTTKWDEVLSGAISFVVRDCDNDNHHQLFALTESSLYAFEFPDFKRRVVVKNIPEDLLEFDQLPGGKIFLLFSTGWMWIVKELFVDRIKRFNLGVKVKTARWSPSKQYLVFITDDDRLMLAGEDYIASEISSQEDGILSQVSLGWGKKETQFQGKAGKYVQCEGREEYTCDVEEADKIAWKDDSSLFAVGSKYKDGRCIKIFDRDGNFLSITDITGLQLPLAWKPGSNFISTVNFAKNKQSVCYVERNGLKFKEYHFSPSKILDLIWNGTGTILTLVYERGCELWTCCNELWSLKQILRFRNRLIHIFWQRNTLHILTESCYKRLRYYQRPNFTANGVLASIHGSEILMYDLEAGNCPCPLYKKSLKMNSAVNAIFGTLAALETNRLRSLHKFEDESEYEEDDRVVDVSNVEKSHWTFANGTVYYCRSKPEGNSVCYSDVSGNENSLCKMRNDITIMGIARGEVRLQTDDGRWWKIDSEGVLKHCEGPREVCELLVEEGGTLFILTRNGILYADGEEVQRNVTSFMAKDGFLAACVLGRFVEVFGVDWNLKESPRKRFYQICRRECEQDSILVALTSFSVVLLTPRGELERYNPRYLSFAKMSGHLEGGEFGEAVHVACVHNLDKNLLFDANPAAFPDLVKDLVSAGDPDPIMAILKDARNEDTVVKYFPWHKRQISDEEMAVLVCKKTATICSIFTKELDGDCCCDKFDAPIILTHTKMGNLTAAVEYAVRRGKLDVLLQFSDPSTIFQHALTSGNFDAAIKISAHSCSVDFEEVKPFLKRLCATENEWYQKYMVNDYLGKRGEAARDLAKYFSDMAARGGPSHDYSPLIDYVMEWSVYEEACEFLDKKSKLYREISLLHAKSLYNSGDKLTAALIYENCRNYGITFEIYCEMGRWMEAFILANRKLRYTKDDMKNLYSRLYEHLYDTGRFSEAGELAYFQRDWESASHCFVLTKQYRRAYFASLNMKLMRDECMISVIDGIVDSCDGILERMLGITNEMDKRYHRLMELRRSKLNGDSNEMADTMSIASSIASSTKGSTMSRTSTIKNERRREKILWNLKPGNRREEQALLKVIKEQINFVHASLPAELKELSEILMVIDRRDLYFKLKTIYEKLLELVETVKKGIWPVGVMLKDSKKDNSFLGKLCKWKGFCSCKCTHHSSIPEDDKYDEKYWDNKGTLSTVSAKDVALSPFPPSPAMSIPSRCKDINHDMEALRLSRQDDPFLQVLASRESLADSAFGDIDIDSPPPQLLSPDVDPLMVPEFHKHMVRSPPPVSWPRSPIFFPHASQESLGAKSCPHAYRSQDLTYYDPSPSNNGNFGQRRSLEVENNKKGGRRSRSVHSLTIGSQLKCLSEAAANKSGIEKGSLENL